MLRPWRGPSQLSQSITEPVRTAIPLPMSSTSVHSSGQWLRPAARARKSCPSGRGGPCGRRRGRRRSGSAACPAPPVVPPRRQLRPPSPSPGPGPPAKAIRALCQGDAALRWPRARLPTPARSGPATLLGASRLGPQDRFGGHDVEGPGPDLEAPRRRHAACPEPLDGKDRLGRPREGVRRRLIGVVPA